jgi:hypothetical protein
MRQIFGLVAAIVILSLVNARADQQIIGQERNMPDKIRVSLYIKCTNLNQADLINKEWRGQLGKLPDVVITDDKPNIFVLIYTILCNRKWAYSIVFIDQEGYFLSDDIASGYPKDTGALARASVNGLNSKVINPARKALHQQP